MIQYNPCTNQLFLVLGLCDVAFHPQVRYHEYLVHAVDPGYYVSLL